MTDVTSRDQASAAESDVLDAELVRQLADRARARGLQLSGDGGLLQNLTKVFMDAALEGELDEHLGYGKHESAGSRRRELT